MFSNLASTWAFNNVSNSFENVVADAGPSPNWFYSTWDTRLTSTGSSNSNQIKLPLASGGNHTYNFIVNWGDGTSDTITVWNQAQATHTYATPGIYNITITGTIRGWRFANTGDKLKLLSISKWGPLNFGNTNAFFYGCSNLNLDKVSDVPDLTAVTSFVRMFSACTSLSSVNRINEWNTANITDMQYMFESAYKFNGDLSNWNTANVTNFYYMFGIDTSSVGNRYGVFNNNGQPGIGNWNTSKVTSTRTMFQQQPFFNQDVGTKVVTVGGTSYIAWNMSVNTQMQFMFNSTVIPGFFNNGGSTSISNWNTTAVTTHQQTFSGQKFFNQDVGTKVVTVGGTSYTAWDIRNSTNLVNFVGCTTVGPVIGTFNNGGSTSIRNWNINPTSAVTLAAAFQNQPYFNQDIGTKVVTVGATSYTAWDTRNATSIQNIVLVSSTQSKFGEFTNGGSTSISNWNTTNVTNMQSAFSGQPLFNHDIGTKVVTVGATSYTAWDIRNVTTLSSMFFVNPSTFNKSGEFNNGGSTSISNWNTSKVTTINSTFAGQAAFNQNLSPTTVTVGATSYTAWNLTGCTIASYTFYQYDNQTPLAFNNGGSTGINSWNVSRVTNMDNMFRNANGFNQPIDNWNVSLVTRFGSTGTTGTTEGFMYGKTAADYSSANYDALLIGWASRSVQPNLTVNFGTIKRTSASTAAVTTLTSAPNNWTIIDGGLV